MPQHLLNIDAEGVLQFVYSDDLSPLLNAGDSAVVRASHVEPVWKGRGWTADLSPVDGPRIGPFERRDGAIAAEVDWLNDQLSAGRRL